MKSAGNAVVMAAIVIAILAAPTSLLAAQADGAGSGETEARSAQAQAGSTDAAHSPAADKAKDLSPPQTVSEAFLIPVGPERKSRKQSLLVIEPRALGYRFLSEHVTLKSGNAAGTRINIAGDLNVENQVFLAPQMNSELNFEVFGMIARLQFTYISHDLHGVAMARKDLWFGGSNFAAGTVIGTHVVHRRMRLRYIQDIIHFPWIEADISIGAEYFYFWHRLDAPSVAMQEDKTENAIPLPGCRVFLVPWPFCRFFADVEGFGWNLGADAGMTGTLNSTVGVWFKFTESWGFVLDFNFRWIMMSEGDTGRIDILFFEFGPGIAIYASL